MKNDTQTKRGSLTAALEAAICRDAHREQYYVGHPKTAEALPLVRRTCRAHVDDARVATSATSDWLADALLDEAVVRSVAEALNDAAPLHLGRDLGTMHRDDIAREGLTALAHSLGLMAE